jgi:hypothetical protein
MVVREWCKVVQFSKFLILKLLSSLPFSVRRFYVFFSFNGIKFRCDFHTFFFVSCTRVLDIVPILRSFPCHIIFFEACNEKQDDGFSDSCFIDRVEI